MYYVQLKKERTQKESKEVTTFSCKAVSEPGGVSYLGVKIVFVQRKIGEYNEHPSHRPLRRMIRFPFFRNFVQLQFPNKG